jgi:uncharacterized Zn finger protein (UPF0148 family)
MKKEKTVKCSNCGVHAVVSVDGRYFCSGCLMSYLVEHPDPGKLEKRLVPVNRDKPHARAIP